MIVHESKFIVVNRCTRPSGRPDLIMSTKRSSTKLGERKANDDPDLKKVVAELKRMVKKTVPGAKETVNPWGIPTFELNGPICYYMTASKHVTFGFALGTSLDDPQGLLEGTGKNLRHVKLRKVEDLKQDGLKKLIESAAKLNREGKLATMGRKKKSAT